MRIDKRKLEIAMARKQMSYKELASKADLTKDTLTRVHMHKRPHPQSVGRIAAALGVDVTEIIAEEEES